MLGRPILSEQQLQQHQAVVPGVRDVVWAPLYDSASYATAGQTQLSFFTTPIGSGTTTAPGASGTKTLADTNLRSAGQLTKGNQFYMTGVEVILFPGVAPGLTAVATAGAVGDFLNDVWDFAKSGVFNFRVQDRDYVTDGPMIMFPPATRLAVNSALVNDNGSGSTAAATYLTLSYAQTSGEPYTITPIFLDANQGFSASITWPAAVALSVAARVYVRLRGYLIRNAQ